MRVTSIRTDAPAAEDTCCSCGRRKLHGVEFADGVVFEVCGLCSPTPNVDVVVRELVGAGG